MRDFRVLITKWDVLSPQRIKDLCERGDGKGSKSQRRPAWSTEGVQDSKSVTPKKPKNPVVDPTLPTPQGAIEDG